MTPSQSERARAGQGKHKTFLPSSLARKHSGPNPVNPTKKNDLLKLLPLIPPIHRDFFKSIGTSRNDKDKGAKEQGDSDIESDFDNKHES